MEYDPVCGDDGNTYSNLCNLLVARCVMDMDINIAHTGACQIGEEEDAEETTNPDPEEAATATSAVTAEINESEVKTSCDASYIPVCGTDDVTYSNVCNLEATAKRLGIKIQVKYEGRCKPVANRRRRR